MSILASHRGDWMLYSLQLEVFNFLKLLGIKTTGFIVGFFLFFFFNHCLLSGE